MPLIATFLYFTILFSTAFARPSIRDSCGPNDQVISEETLIHDNKEIKFVTRSCPGFAALRNTTTTSSTVRKRQISQCSDTCFGFDCDTTAAQPDLNDCDNLTDALGFVRETIVVPPRALQEVSSGTCLFVYANLDIVTYNVCSDGFAALGVTAVTHCFTSFGLDSTFTAGTCDGPQIPGADFIVESAFI
ncbi:hypothetical protein M422DRAFT_31051 [Sphaerobolus stellatus SS14]|uniref:Uncharacterized protein n=1 Tax=Sphaerobolus stellatus (strain SS14) TaxID=990650 RepID=A0A0C9VMP4_SPHS4|nr:hypothetical protein M422DRAFT_31051 [Sphaerobolus stellatus SS14]